MALVDALINLSMPPEQAIQFSIQSLNISSSVAVTAAGSTINDAFQLTVCLNRVTTVGAGQGVKLFFPPTLGTSTPLIGAQWIIHNLGASDLKVYPPTALGVINTGGAGAAITLTTAAKQIAFITYMGGVNFSSTIATGT